MRACGRHPGATQGRRGSIPPHVCIPPAVGRSSEVDRVPLVSGLRFLPARSAAPVACPDHPRRRPLCGIRRDSGSNRRRGDRRTAECGTVGPPNGAVALSRGRRTDTASGRTPGWVGRDLYRGLEKAAVGCIDHAVKAIGGDRDRAPLGSADERNGPAVGDRPSGANSRNKKCAREGQRNQRVPGYCAFDDNFPQREYEESGRLQNSGMMPECRRPQMVPASILRLAVIALRETWKSAY
jgi:hypothetical protein